MSMMEDLIRYGMTHQYMVLVSLPVSDSAFSVLSCGWSSQDQLSVPSVPSVRCVCRLCACGAVGAYASCLVDL